MKRSWVARSRLALCSAALAACGSHGTTFLDVGRGDDGGALSLADASSGGAPSALDAHIEENHVAVTLVQVGCAGSCATVQAVASGGRPPYTYAWNDGATDAVRTICPAADRSYDVTVTDTGKAGELGSPAQTAKASVTADVFACPDGGSAPEAGVTGCQTLLVVTPPSGTVTGPGALVCSSSDAGGGGQLGTYFGVPVALKMGSEYQLSEDVTGTILAGPPPRWDFYGSPAACVSPPGGELLGSMTFDPSVGHQSVCFRPSQDYGAIDWYTLAVAAGIGQGTYTLCLGCDRPDASP